jgi:predicted DNA-binding transcriptional regulator YafY
VQLTYVDAAGAETDRTVVPLGLYFWGKQWLVAGYCLLRNDYRSFRVDRVSALRDTDPEPSRLSAVSPPVSLQGYIRAMEDRSRCEVPK